MRRPGKTTAQRRQRAVCARPHSGRVHSLAPRPLGTAPSRRPTCGRARLARSRCNPRRRAPLGPRLIPLRLRCTSTALGHARAAPLRVDDPSVASRPFSRFAPACFVCARSAANLAYQRQSATDGPLCPPSAAGPPTEGGWCARPPGGGVSQARWSKVALTRASGCAPPSTDAKMGRPHTAQGLRKRAPRALALRPHALMGYQALGGGGPAVVPSTGGGGGRKVPRTGPARAQSLIC